MCWYCFYKLIYVWKIPMKSILTTKAGLVYNELERLHVLIVLRFAKEPLFIFIEVLNWSKENVLKYRFFKVNAFTKFNKENSVNHLQNSILIYLKIIFRSPEHQRLTRFIIIKTSYTWRLTHTYPRYTFRFSCFLDRIKYIYAHSKHWFISKWSVLKLSTSNRFK